ncbi:hypothetical protein M422DRAFT_152036 [Sphaerobolus stellatus SS14]|uniref:Carboxylic ester hydrolase n=2 Tax=Sphaerobolus stellatus (strain SS14) TaxID=990650 RepID=A0A0C9T1B3_SPHS4|nr:hypothetical protein M422DRAFT_40031 [Sphaerobolus stellatus SS14]KIJ55822.1 hypothetical protein M422DRAFT_152036 [Sphaerobolus stellatus SS14]
MTLSRSLSLLICVISLISNVNALGSQSPVIDLGYARYEGTAQSNGLDQFLGMRFAAPPLGDLRFRKPAPPANVTGVQPAKEFGPVCFGLPTPLTAALVQSQNASEDCLFINVWAPSNATSKSKLPVLFWILGGGYTLDYDSNYNGSDLVESTGNNMIFVSINYRVGPFGFLASERIQKNGDLNAGLLDQRFALQWVQDHITSFGGDPNQVVLVGDSAGAGSIALHLVAYGGQPTKLFAGAFGVSPYLPTQLRVSELEWQFDLVASRAGCEKAQDPLTCLRTKSSAELQAINVGMPYPGRTKDSNFPFSPTIDGEFLTDFPYRLFEEGRFVKVPAIFGDDTNDGTIFADNVSTPADVASFLKDQYPQLSDNNTAAINALYPLQTPNPFPSHAPYFASAAGAIGEATFICPGITISTMIAQHTKSWNYRFNILTSFQIADDIGVSHTSEISFLFGLGNAGPQELPIDQDDLSYIPIIRAYYTSFVRSLDPNAHPVNGSVFWPQFNPEKTTRLLLQVNDTRLEDIPLDQKARCEFWKGLAIKLEQ